MNRRSLGSFGVLLPLLATLAAPARAQSVEGSEEMEAPALATGYSLDPPSRFAVGLDGYAGIALLSTAADARAHDLIGGLLRAQVGYVEVAGFVETTDRVKESWTMFGGAAGAFFPVHRWVDFELLAGLGSRRYTDPDPRFGPHGYDLRSLSLHLRAGISDRSTHKLLGARLGAQVVADVDLGTHDAPWEYQGGTEDEPVMVEGTTPVGGTSTGIVLVLGFDLAFGRPSGT